MKDWKHITSVIVDYGCGTKYYFDSFKDAVLWLGSKINSLQYGHHRSKLYWERDRKDFYYYGSGDEFIIRDQYDLIIPVWRIKEEWNNLSHNDYHQYKLKHYRWYRKFNKRKTSEFRREPVYGIGKSHWHRGRHAKNVKSDIINLIYDENDFELKEFKVKIRKRDIPDTRDVYRMLNDNRNWKRYRRNQWKE